MKSKLHYLLVFFHKRYSRNCNPFQQVRWIIVDGVTLIDVEAYAVDIRGLRIGDPDLHNIMVD